MKRLVKAVPIFSLLATAALAAGSSPVAVTGYNFDGIVERTAAPPYSGAAQSLDLSNEALFEIGLPGATAGGLPQGGLFSFTANSNTYAFQLAPYGGSNLLRVNPTGTLTLTSPGKFATLAVLGFTTQNNSGGGGVEMVGDATLNFSDCSSSLYSHAIDLSDWFAVSPLNPNVATGAIGGLVNLTSGTAAGAFETASGGPKFYVSVLTLSTADAGKNLTSITIGNFPFGGNTFQFIMGVGGTNPVTPPPATVPALSDWALAALGVLLVAVGVAALPRLAGSTARS